MNRVVTDYPWDSLPEVSRRGVARTRRLRAALRAAFDVTRISDALASVLTADVEITVRDVVPSAPPPAERSIHVATADSTISFSVEPDAAFASVLLARILERPARLVDARATLDDRLRGALTALAVEVARRAGATTELVALEGAPAGEGIGVRVTVLLDDRPYGVFAWAAGVPAPGRDTDVDLDDLGETPVAVPLVAAASVAALRDLTELSPGDVWLPQGGWFDGGAGDRRAASGGVRDPFERAVLASPSGERGVVVGHSEGGRIVVLGGVVALAVGVAEAPRQDDDSNMGGQEEDLKQAVLDSPVVVRVEVGTVTLAARQWAALRTGDVIETGVRVGEQVVLRIAGREVARGELVNVEGELGVKILELVAPGRTP